MEAVLRPYGLGGMQWYVLTLLEANGPLGQRELTSMLELERATLSGIVGALTRKELVEQVADTHDKRQKVLHLTTAGTALLRTVPDPIELITTVAFDGMDHADIDTAHRVLRHATQRLNDYRKEALS